MGSEKVIYCPKCKRKVTKWDGKATINPLARCKNCNVMVMYDIRNDVTKIIDKPVRSQSSGLTFY